VFAHVGYWGFDPTNNKDVYSAIARADFMTYRRPPWVSEYTYTRHGHKLRFSA
jgi:hypothetical protein